MAGFQEDMGDFGGGELSDDLAGMCGGAAGGGLSLAAAAPASSMPMMWIHIHKVGGSFICGAAYLNEESVVQPSGNCNWSPHDGGAGSVYEERTTCKERAAYFKENGYSWGQIERVLSDDICWGDFDYGIWLRDPVALAESEVNHVKYTPEQVQAHLDCLNTTCFSVPSQDHMPLWMYFDNYVIRALLGPPVYNLPPGRITQEHYARALKLLGRFQVVIIMEQALEDQDILLDAVGWTKWPAKGDKHNPQGLRIRGPHGVTFTEAQAEIVRRRNRYDNLLYQHFAAERHLELHDRGRRHPRRAPAASRGGSAERAHPRSE